jgi:hypothetical protein
MASDRQFKVEGRKERAKRRDTEFTEEGKRDGPGLAAIMWNYSTVVTDCQ